MRRARLCLRSPAFDDGAPIPARHAHDGADLSPCLEWDGVPAGTVSFVVLCEDDPDAPMGNWVHWIVFNLPASVRRVAEGMPRRKRRSDDPPQGRNDFMLTGYSGPCSGDGNHRYRFRLYALDTVIGARPGARKAEVTRAMDGHVLSEALLTGTYGESTR
jgi:Raf kinase inhibitor-like YbhB/YbcL family protein